MRKATYKEIPELLENMMEFEGNSMSGVYDPQCNAYHVYSYNTIIATIYCGICKLNTEYYSNTTSRQQNIVKRCFPKFVEVSHEELNGYKYHY